MMLTIICGYQYQKQYSLSKNMTSSFQKKHNLFLEISVKTPSSYDILNDSKSESETKIESSSPKSHSSRSSSFIGVTPQTSSSIQIYSKIHQTLASTTKADKYVRLCSSVVKLLRATDSKRKNQLSKCYIQLLKLRQVIRWNGLYENIQQFGQLGTQNFDKKNLFDFFFKCFQLLGDVLDRMMFVLDLIPNHKFQSFYEKISKIQQNCYFIECVIQIGLNLRALLKVKSKKQRNLKAVKLLKYILDAITSYCKFTYRLGELAPKNIAIINIVSSLAGIFTILY